MKVQSVEIRGNHRTDRSFFDNELQEALSSDSFLELHTSLVKTTKRLESFDVFRSVKTEIKIPTSVKGNEAIPIKIFIDVQEKNMLSSKVSPNLN